MNRPRLQVIDTREQERRARARERQRRYRQRKEAGLRVLRVAADEEDLAVLARSGLIDINATDHDPDLEEEINRLLHRLAENLRDASPVDER